MILPLVLAEIMVAIWVNRYHIGVFGSVPVNIGWIIVNVMAVALLVRLVTIGMLAKIMSSLGLLILITSFGALASSSKQSRAPMAGIYADHSVKHVLLISIDTLRADALSFYNKQAYQTPNIDDLACESVVFRNAFSCSPWTLPSVASIMTGLPVAVHLAKDYNSKLPDAFPTLAEFMREAGYLTCGIGKNRFLTRKFGMSQGFMEYEFYSRNKRAVFLGEKILKLLRQIRPRRDTATERITDLAVEWIGSNFDKDFFLWVHYLDPHLPYAPPKEYLPESEPAPRIGEEFAMLGEVRSGHFVPTREEKHWIRELYFSEVRYVDSNVGRILEQLKACGIYDESMIILTSDHGEEFWEHDGFGHGHSQYNELLWVPLVVKIPFSTRKGVVARGVSLESIMPFILGWCGIQYDSNMFPAGPIAAPQQTDISVGEERPLISAGLYKKDKDKVAVFFEGIKYKYILSLVTGREELYDLLEDPGEKTNIVRLAKGKVEQAKEILAEHTEQSERLREYYSIESKEEIELDEDTLNTLKSLGYL